MPFEEHSMKTGAVVTNGRRVWLQQAAVLCGAAAVAGPLSRARAATVPEQLQTAQAAAAASQPGRAPATEPLRSIDELGIDLMMLRLDASDFLIDLRYRVKDVAKAQSLLERKVSPVLVNEATGDRYYIPQTPKVGALRQSATTRQPAIVGRVYFMLFANPDRRLKAGERVTLYAGDSIIKDIVVR
jgi:hypothetical protein